MVVGERGGEGDEREGKGEVKVKVKGKKGGKERETRGDRRQEAQLLRTSYQGHYLCVSLPSSLPLLSPSPSPPPLGAVFLIDSQESLKWLDRVVQRMCVISENHQLQPLVGMPLVILALGEEFMNENSAEVRHVTEVANR